MSTLTVIYDSNDITDLSKTPIITGWLKKLLELAGVDVPEGNLLKTHVVRTIWGTPDLEIEYDNEGIVYMIENKPDILGIITDIVIECDDTLEVDPLLNTVIDYD